MRCAPASLQTVPAAQVTSMARALEKPVIDKGRVWIVFIGGAAALFGATLLLENNPAFFPSISKANKAAENAIKAAEVCACMVVRKDVSSLSSLPHAHVDLHACRLACMHACMHALVYNRSCTCCVHARALSPYVCTPYVCTSTGGGCPPLVFAKLNIGAQVSSVVGGAPPLVYAPSPLYCCLSLSLSLRRTRRSHAINALLFACSCVRSRRLRRRPLHGKWSASR